MTSYTPFSNITACVRIWCKSVYFLPQPLFTYLSPQHKSACKNSRSSSRRLQKKKQTWAWPLDHRLKHNQLQGYATRPSNESTCACAGMRSVCGYATSAIIKRVKNLHSAENCNCGVWIVLKSSGPHDCGAMDRGDLIGVLPSMCPSDFLFPITRQP